VNKPILLLPEKTPGICEKNYRPKYESV